MVMINKQTTCCWDELYVAHCCCSRRGRRACSQIILLVWVKQPLMSTSVSTQTSMSQCLNQRLSDSMSPCVNVGVDSISIYSRERSDVMDIVDVLEISTCRLTSSILSRVAKSTINAAYKVSEVEDHFDLGGGV